MQTLFPIQPNFLLAFGWPQGMEWLILLAVALLIFGRRLPEVARSFGKSINEFKKGMNEVNNEIHKEPMDQAPSDPARLPNANSGNAMPSGMNQGAAPGVSQGQRSEDHR